MSAWVYLGVAVCGALGAFARLAVDVLAQLRHTMQFPVETLLVNLVGSFLLGLLVGIDLVGDEALLVGTGVLGSFTTFSTWMLETERLGEDGLDRAAAFNLLGGATFGLLAAAAGWALGALA